MKSKGAAEPEGFRCDTVPSIEDPIDKPGCNGRILKLANKMTDKQLHRILQSQEPIGIKRFFPGQLREENMRTILLIIIVLLLVGALPTWPYSASWGYYPSGGLGLVLLVLLILALLGMV